MGRVVHKPAWIAIPQRAICRTDADIAVEKRSTISIVLVKILTLADFESIRKDEGLIAKLVLGDESDAFSEKVRTIPEIRTKVHFQPTALSWPRAGYQNEISVHKPAAARPRPAWKCWVSQARPNLLIAPL
jgi:hypothetical protein